MQRDIPQKVQIDIVATGNLTQTSRYEDNS